MHLIKIWPLPAHTKNALDQLLEELASDIVPVINPMPSSLGPSIVLFPIDLEKYPRGARFVIQVSDEPNNLRSTQADSKESAVAPLSNGDIMVDENFI